MIWGVYRAPCNLTNPFECASDYTEPLVYDDEACRYLMLPHGNVSITYSPHASMGYLIGHIFLYH